MVWENRNGRRYYYRKRRIGKTVISEYVGSGWIGEAAAELDELDQARKKAEQQAQRQEKAQYVKVESDVRRWQECTRTLTRAVLLLAGYHPHKGQWRKRQDDRTS